MSQRADELCLKQIHYLHEMLRALAERDAAQGEEQYRARNAEARAFKTACDSIAVELFDLRPAVSGDAASSWSEVEARLHDIGNRCWTHKYQFLSKPNGTKVCVLEADTPDGQHFVVVDDSLLGACRQMSASLRIVPSVTEEEGAEGSRS